APDAWLIRALRAQGLLHRAELQHDRPSTGLADDGSSANGVGRYHLSRHCSVDRVGTHETPLVRRRLSRNPRINIKWFDADLLINITRDRDNSEEEKHDTHADAGVSLSCVSVRWWESRISRRNKKATSRIALVRG